MAVVSSGLLIALLLVMIGCGGGGTPASSETTVPSVTTASGATGSSTTAATTASTTGAAGQTKELVMGSIMPLSGPLSVVGLAWNRGFELYFDKINEEGGVKIGADTYTVKFLEEDGKGAAEAAGAAARKLVSDNHATFLFGEIMEGANAAIYDVASQNKVLQVLPTSNIPGEPTDIGKGKDYLVRPMIGFDDANTANLEYLKKTYPNVKTIAVTCGDTAGFPEMVQDFTDAAQARGYTVSHVEKWSFGMTDFVPVMTRVLAAKPDAIFIMASAQAPYQLMAARQLGFKGPIFANAPLGPEVTVRIAGPDLTTDYFCNGLDPAQPTPVMAEIMDRYQRKYKDEWISDAVLGWDEAWIIVQAMQKAQSVDPSQVLAALDSMTNPGDLQTSFGPGAMGGLDRFGVNRALVRQVPISYIMNGKISLVGYFDSKNK
jgi:branched-chain amino acid transport system substrate-binding protein